MNNRQFYHIAIEGGPGAGKTTGISRIKQTIEQLGKQAVIVPEAATMYIQSGFDPKKVDPVDFQRSVFQLQYQNEEFWKKQIINSPGDHDVVFFYDRSLLGGAAYLEDLHTPTNLSLFEEMIVRPQRFHGLEEVRSRYDAVIHLVTAAIGAEDYYTTDNNDARDESIEQARIMDCKTQAVYLGHRHLRVVDNFEADGRKKSFDKKLDVFSGEILDVLGYPQPIEDEDWYVLHDFDINRINVPYVIIDIEQVYLNTPHEERIRMRKTEFSNSYYHTMKRPNTEGDGRVEVECLIDVREARSLLLNRDTSLNTIHKKRVCFLFNNQYFEVDIFFEGMLGGLIKCEREKTRNNRETVLPDFLGRHTCVTNNHMFTNRHLASLDSLASLELPPKF